jgi:hypothetical protein
MSTEQTRRVLVQKFEARHIDAGLKHFVAAIEKYIAEDWDGVALKAGKFVEAVTKALMLKCGKTLPSGRRFSAGNELRQLEQLSAYPDVLRLVIPKAGIFIYEVVNNRGGRHDAGDIDANEMDAKVIIPLMSWTVAEMVRFCSVDGDTSAAMALIDEVTNKIYPYFETIDGRSYVNIDKLGGADIALLLLYSSYPKRISRQALVDLIERHGVAKSAANVAVHRLKNIVDDHNGEWKLRGLGRQKAESLLKKLQLRKRTSGGQR